MKSLFPVIFVTAVLGCAHQPGAPDATVLSAGAVELGLHSALEAYERETGKRVKVTYNTAPQVRERIEQKGEKYDLVIITPGPMDAFAKAGLVGAQRLTLGSVGQGIAVRAGAPAPDISSVDAMKRALQAADGVVFNRATGGQYIEGMLKKIGVYGEIERKTTRYPGAHEVMEHLAKGNGREVGFAPIPEIAQFKDKGVRYVGPLPAEVQQRNAYVASAMAGAANAQGAADLVRFLGTPAARAALASGGVE